MNNNRLMIAGTNSGCGKTTITCAIIKALIDLENDVISFKSGPDFVDPMFHNVILKTMCRNLDLFFCDENTLKHLVNKNSNEKTIAIIEGVMGYYDGLGGVSSQYSSSDIAKTLSAPTILVVDGKGISLSLCAMIKGYLSYQENNITGIIINNISSMFYKTIKEVIENECNIEVLGYLEKDDSITIEHRHLGLLMPNEISDIKERINRLANKAKETIDLNRLIEISKTAGSLEDNYIYPNIEINVKIGIVEDDAFCFYYQDNVDLLKKLGATIIKVSLLDDEILPSDLDGLIIGGGYPELFIEKLSNNKSMITCIQNVVKNKLPIIAESGGFIYLGSSLKVDEKTFDLSNVIEMKSVITNKLEPFGYVNNHCLKDNFLVNKNEVLKAHEFHYSKTNYDYDVFDARKIIGSRSWNTGYCNEHIFSGFSHYHFYSNIKLAINFLEKCKLFKMKRGEYSEKVTT